MQRKRPEIVSLKGRRLIDVNMKKNVRLEIGRTGKCKDIEQK